jgi:crotonobetainyl-CoA:carnitine CoA-transferase CaiB-like acyl-CoA transferase
LMMVDGNDAGTAPLRGLKVVEFSDFESVQFCGRTLAALGADVVKLEEPGGDPLRRRPPQVEAGDGLRSLAFEYLNAGKGSVEVDLSTQDGLAEAGALISSADVVIATPECRERLQLDAIPTRPGQLRVLPGVFGGRPQEGGPTTAFTRLHAATSGYLIPADKDMSVRPGWGGPYVFESMFGTCLAVSILAELERGSGGEIDFSYQGYGVWMEKMIFPRIALSDSFDIHRNTNAYPFGGSMRCSDGYACVFVIEEHQWRSLARLLDRDAWLSDPRFANGVLRLNVQDEIDGVLAAWCVERSVEEVVNAGRAADIPIARVRTPQEVLDWPQLAERNFIADAETGFGRVPVAALPFGTGLPSVPLTPAPQLGQQTVDQAWRSDATAAGAAPRPPTLSGELPLAGLRVLDFTWAAAGPIITSIMAYLGADIVKVELRSRPDLMRTAQKQYGYSEDDDLDSSPSFQELATGKRSIELDLTNPADRETAFRLASVADVLVENMRPGKIEQLGLSYEAVSAANPGIVMCSQSATGRVEGPGIPGYAPIFWAEGGGAWLTGWREQRPGVVRGPVDFHAAAYACAGTLALLHRQKVTGIGGYIDCSAIETVSACIGPELMGAAVANIEGTRQGNIFPGVLLNDVFPCFGNDQWIAVSIRNDAEWAAFAQALNSDSLMATTAVESDYATIAALTSRCDVSRLEGRLLALGVPAARSLSLRAALNDARLADRGIWQTIHHPKIGDQTVVGLPWTFDGKAYEMHTPGPTLGEHGVQIRSDWLG